MPSRQRFCRDRCAMSLPLNVTRPPSHGNVPVMRLNRVVLPAPFGPTIPSASPSFRETLRSSMTTTPPKDFERFSIVRIDMGRILSPFHPSRGPIVVVLPGLILDGLQLGLHRDLRLQSVLDDDHVVGE